MRQTEDADTDQKKRKQRSDDWLTAQQIGYIEEQMAKLAKEKYQLNSRTTRRWSRWFSAE